MNKYKVFCNILIDNGFGGFIWVEIDNVMLADTEEESVVAMRQWCLEVGKAKDCRVLKVEYLGALE